MVRLDRAAGPSACVGAILVIASAVACSDEPIGNPDPLRVEIEASQDPMGRGDSIVDFGSSLVGKRVDRSVTIRNDEMLPATIEVQGLAAPFGSVFPMRTLEVRAEGVLTFVFTFEPEAAGAAAAQVSVTARIGSRTKRIPLVLVGTGVEPAFDCEPGPLDFGRVLTRVSRTLSWRCENRSRLRTWVRLDDLSGDDADRFEARILAKNGGFARTLEVKPGEEAEVLITFDGKFPGAAAASVALLESDGVRLGGIDLRGTAVDDELIVETDGCLDFGDVPFGGSAERTLQVTNPLPSWHEVATEIPGDEDGEFTVSPSGWIRFEAFESKAVTVRFEPRRQGEREVIVRLDRRWGTSVEACARGVGHGPQLICDDRLDFPELVAGFASTSRIRCRNDGFFRDGEAERPLQVSAVRSSTPAFQASVVGGIRSGGYKIGEGFEIDVTFAPNIGGTHAGAIEIHGDGAPGGRVSVPAAGSAIELPPCSAAIEPRFLDFGIVSPGRVATAYVGVRNLLTSGSCRASVFLSPDSDPALEFGPGRAQTLGPGKSMVLPVSFAAPAAGTYARGRLIVEVSDPQDPIREVVVEGRSGTPCLTFEPEAIEFPSVPRGCATPVRTVTIRSCPGATIQSIDLASGLDADSFFISRRPELPATPSDDEPLAFDVWLSPQGPESIHGAVVVEDGQGSHRLPLQGRAGELQTDMHLIETPDARLHFSIPPADQNADGMVNEKDIYVRVDGLATPPVDDFDNRVWFYEPDAQVLRFAPAFEPRVGSEVWITFKSACLSSPAVPD